MDLGLPEMSPETAARAGAGSIVIGVAPVGGAIPAEWGDILRRSARAGLDVVSRYLDAARLTNPDVRLGGVSLNTAKLEPHARAAVLDETAARMGVPCFDPLRGPIDAVLDRIVQPMP